MIDQESIKKIETRLKGIPLIDAAIFEILSLLDKPETNFQQIVEKLSPEISAKFLKMANSAYYGRNVRTVEYAIRVLGFKAMKQILTTSTIIDHFATKADLKGFNFEKFQKHAHFCAAVSRVLGEMLGYEALEDLFTAAMLHNIGKLVIVVYLGDEYKEIDALKKSQGISSREAEKRVLGVTHAEIGGLALKQSNASKDIYNAISHHEADDRDLLTGPPLRLELIIREASRIIDKFTLPKKFEPLEIIDLLQETIDQGEKLYEEGIKVQVLSEEHEHIFQKLVKEASELVYVELKETLEERTDDVDDPLPAGQ